MGAPAAGHCGCAFSIQPWVGNMKGMSGACDRSSVSATISTDWSLLRRRIDQRMVPSPVKRTLSRVELDRAVGSRIGIATTISRASMLISEMSRSDWPGAVAKAENNPGVELDDVADDAIGEPVAIGCWRQTITPRSSFQKNDGSTSSASAINGATQRSIGSCADAGAEPNAIESANPAHHKTR